MSFRNVRKSPPFRIVTEHRFGFSPSPGDSRPTLSRPAKPGSFSLHAGKVGKHSTDEEWQTFRGGAGCFVLQRGCGSTRQTKIPGPHDKGRGSSLRRGIAHAERRQRLGTSDQETCEKRWKEKPLSFFPTLIVATSETKYNTFDHRGLFPFLL